MIRSEHQRPWPIRKVQKLGYYLFSFIHPLAWKTTERPFCFSLLLFCFISRSYLTWAICIYLSAVARSIARVSFSIFFLITILSTRTRNKTGCRFTSRSIFIYIFFSLHQFDIWLAVWNCGATCFCPRRQKSSNGGCRIASYSICNLFKRRLAAKRVSKSIAQGPVGDLFIYFFSKELKNHTNILIELIER